MINLTNTTRIATCTLIAAGLSLSTEAALIFGVDFEDGSGGFDRTPDDLNLTDGITGSSGTGDGVYDGWTLTNNGALRNDAGANSAGAYEGDFPARLQDSDGASWSINIPSGVILDLDNIFFATRGATGGGGREIKFRTSIDNPDEFLYENVNLPGRSTGWTEVDIDLADAKYKGLTDTTVEFIWISSNAADLDGIVVSGTIVPEPSSVSLVLLGMGGLALRRRR